VIEIRQTETFAAWFRKLRDRRSRARIQVRIDRLSLGNPGDSKPVGEGCRSFGSITVQVTGCISSDVATR
jgi:putative addiction module killer protein